MEKGKFRVGQDDELYFWCPGCKMAHGIIINKNKRPCWDFNQDYDNPTISPSILVRGFIPITNEQAERILNGEKIEPIPFVCHSFIRNGEIQYLSDCTHELAGKTVTLEKFSK